MVDKARQIALKILYKIDKEGAYSNIALDEELKISKNKLNEKDIGLISQIVYGVTNWKLTLDEIIKKYSKIRIKKISPWIINILRMGIYQIIFLDKIPKSAAVDESVNLAKRYGHKTSSGFVNAILRKVTIQDYKELFNIKEKVDMISKTQSMPIWIIEELLKNNEIQEVEEICKNLNMKSCISLRVNTLKISKEELKDKLKDKKIYFEDGDLEDFLIVDKIKNIEKLTEFKEGLFTIQDESAGLASIILSPKEGQNILDACSSPGGKTTYLAQIMNNKGNIEAWDIYEHRIKLVEENAKRLGITNITTKINDASIYHKELEEKFDKILLDVPCLGIGVIKKKPDIKWRKEKHDIQEINKIQYDILNTCSKYLKKGGNMVYATCSIIENENEHIIEKFLKENKNFEISRYKMEENNSYKKYLKNNKYLTVKPDEKHDGFFICNIQKMR